MGGTTTHARPKVWDRRVFCTFMGVVMIEGVSEYKPVIDLDGQIKKAFSGAEFQMQVYDLVNRGLLDREKELLAFVLNNRAMSTDLLAYLVWEETERTGQTNPLMVAELAEKLGLVLWVEFKSERESLKLLSEKDIPGPIFSDETFPEKELMQKFPGFMSFQKETQQEGSDVSLN